MAEINDLSITDASNTARFPENQAPSSVNDGARALEGLIARWHKDTNASITAGGTGDAITVAAIATLSAYYDGLVIAFNAAAANTGATTLNVDSVGAKAVFKNFNTALAANDIKAGQKVICIYDSDGNASAGAWQMISHLGNGSLAAATQAEVDTGTSTSVAVTPGTLNPTAMTAETAPAVGDKVMLADVSASNALRGMTLENMFKVINGLTQDSSPDTAADFAVTYDASASAAKKVLLSAMGGPWSFVSATAVTAVANIDVTGLSAGYDYLIVADGTQGSTDGSSLTFRYSQDGGSTYDSTSGDYQGPGGDLTMLFGAWGGTGNLSNEIEWVSALFHNPNSSGAHKGVLGHATYVNTTGGIVSGTSPASRYKKNTSACNAIRIMRDSGNFAAVGNVYVFKRKLS